MNKEMLLEKYPEHCALYMEYLLYLLTGNSAPREIESPWHPTSPTPVERIDDSNLFYEVLERDWEEYRNELMGQTCRVIGDFAYSIETMLLKHFGTKGQFKIEHLTELSPEEKDKFEWLVYKMMGHSAFYNYFTEGDSEE